ncbi:SagB/ThcOx family dehydrogenase [Mycoplasmatota bacterium zrk1]
MEKNIGKKFIEFTKYDYSTSDSDQEVGIASPSIDMPYDVSKTLIDLPDPALIKLNNTNLKTLIEERRSVRHYSKNSLNLQELSYLLWCTQGVKEIINRTPTYKITLRTVPSAGARHPLETVLLINNVKELEPGLYRYIASKHKLIQLTDNSNISVNIANACLKQSFVAKSSVAFIWVADIYKTIWRYKERSYRYALLDAGHVCQNLYLAAESIDSGVCAVAAYDDNEINRILGLDGENQFVVYIATIGKKIKSNL